MEFEITTEAVKEFIGCAIEKRKDEILLHQPDLIKKLLRNFKNDIKNSKDFNTLAGAGFKIARPQKGETKTLQRRNADHDPSLSIIC